MQSNVDNANDIENQTLLTNLIQQFDQININRDALPRGGMRKLWDAANAQENPDLIWKNMVAICEKRTSASGQMKTWGKRAPGRALLYRAIVQHQKNIVKNRVKPGITTLEQLMIEQQKQEAIADLERKKNELPLVGAFNLSPEAKIRAYDLLIEKIRDSDINTPLETLIAAGSATMSTVVTKPNRGTYTLPGTPQATIQHILSDNRRFNRNQATSEKRLIRLRNKAKKAPPHTTLTKLGLLAEAAVEQEIENMTEQEMEIQFIEEIMQKPDFMKRHTIYYDLKKFPKAFHFYSSKFHPGRCQVDVIDMTNAKKGKDGVQVKKILGTWSKGPHGQWQYKNKPKKFGIKIMFDDSSRILHKYSYQENRIVYESLPFRKMKVPMKSGPLLTTTKMKWLPGRHLGETIRCPKGKQKILACIALQRALQEQIHDQKIAHLDTKPNNVMTNYPDLNNPIFTFFDFDISVKKGRKITAGVGTPFYFSSEMVKAVGLRIDEKKDFWSLGVVLFQLLFEKMITNTDVQMFYNTYGSFVFDPTNEAHFETVMKREVNDNDRRKLELIWPLFHDENASLDDSIQTFENVRLHGAPKEIRDAYDAANRARQTLREMRENLQNDKFNYQKIYDTIVGPLDPLSEITEVTDYGPEVISEYVHTLGISSLYHCDTKEAVKNTVEGIIQQFIKNKQSDDSKIKYAYLKFWREVDKSRLTLDQMEELNKTVAQYTIDNDDDDKHKRISYDHDDFSSIPESIEKKNVPLDLAGTIEEDEGFVSQSISNLLQQIAKLPWYHEYNQNAILDPQNLENLGQNYAVYKALSTQLQQPLQTDTSPNLLNDRPNSAYARELTERAIVSLENYLREGMTFNTVHELLIYQQKQDVIQFCQQSCARVSDKAFDNDKQVREREKWGAYRELSDYLVASLARKDACLTQVIGEHRRANFSQFASFFLANVRSIFSTSGRAFNKICQLPDPDLSKMSCYEKKPVAAQSKSLE